MVSNLCVILINGSQYDMNQSSDIHADIADQRICNQCTFVHNFIWICFLVFFFKFLIDISLYMNYILSGIF